MQVKKEAILPLGYLIGSMGFQMDFYSNMTETIGGGGRRRTHNISNTTIHYFHIDHHITMIVQNVRVKQGELRSM